ncbi:MAG: 3-dehydroquinate synthase [Bacteroidota bacterium]
MVNNKATLLKNIYLGHEALKALHLFLKKSSYKQYFVVCDQNTLKYCLPMLISNCPALQKAEIFEIEAGESSKCLEVAAQIWQCLIDNNAGKNTLMINLGGGVVCDLGAFCASVYKRGIDFVNVPTSLLAMADASVGSKTAIDLNGIKNIIGTFYDAKSVFIEPILLFTLPNREIKNGLAEIVKMALIGDKALWLKLNKSNTSLDEKIIQQAIQIKSKIVLKDPFDKGIRQSLNYGHSIGHAIEALYADKKIPILHGEAVVMGMIIENHIAHQLKLLNKKALLEVNDYLIRNFKPKSLPLGETEACLKYLQHDKKNTNSKWKFSLLNRIGQCKIQVDVKSAQVKKAFLYYAKEVK